MLYTCNLHNIVHHVNLSLKKSKKKTFNMLSIKMIQDFPSLQLNFVPCLVLHKGRF